MISRTGKGYLLPMKTRISLEVSEKVDIKSTTVRTLKPFTIMTTQRSTEKMPITVNIDSGWNK